MGPLRILSTVATVWNKKYVRDFDRKKKHSSSSRPMNSDSFDKSCFLYLDINYRPSYLYALRFYTGASLDLLLAQKI